MALYAFRPDAARTLDRTGLTQAEIARRAGISKFGLRDKLNRGQRTRGPTAWKIARVVAQANQMSEDHSFAVLFEEVIEPEQEPARTMAYSEVQKD